MLGDGLACWDLDDVIDEQGQLSEDAAAVLDEVGDSALWVERSLSGRGLHVFVRSRLPSRQTKHVSFYSYSRFIAVTGRRFSR